MERYPQRRSSATSAEAARFRFWMTVLALAAGLQGCQTSPPATPVATTPVAEAPAPTAKPPAPGDSPLAAEAKWLTELFAGTPVQVVGERDGSVRVSVPMKYAFDAAQPGGGAGGGQAAVAPKAPLLAVLDKVSQSLKRQPTAKLQAATPAGPRSAERVAAMRTQLANRGVPNWRVAAAAPPADDQVLLRLVAPPVGMRLQEDGTLAPPASGRGSSPASR